MNICHTLDHHQCFCSTLFNNILLLLSHITLQSFSTSNVLAARTHQSYTTTDGQAAALSLMLHNPSGQFQKRVGETIFLAHLMGGCPLPSKVLKKMQVYLHNFPESGIRSQESGEGAITRTKPT